MPEAPRRAGAARGTLLLVGLAAAVGVAFGISAVRGVLAPIVLALVLTITVQPIRGVLERRGAGKGVASAAAMLLVLLLVGGFCTLLVLALLQFAGALPDYAGHLEGAADTVGGWLTALGLDPEQRRRACCSSSTRHAS